MQRDIKLEKLHQRLDILFKNAVRSMNELLVDTILKYCDEEKEEEKRI